MRYVIRTQEFNSTITARNNISSCPEVRMCVAKSGTVDTKNSLCSKKLDSNSSHMTGDDSPIFQVRSEHAQMNYINGKIQVNGPIL